MNSFVVTFEMGFAFGEPAGGEEGVRVAEVGGG